MVSKRIAAAGALALALVILLATVWLSGGATARAASESCGTVSLGSAVKAKVTIDRGSPGCSTARSIAREYEHPKQVKYYCHPTDHICEYGVYSQGWRCTGLFQGYFACWLGGNVKGKGASASFSGTLVDGRASRRRVGDTTAGAGGASGYRLLAAAPGIFSASGRGGRLGACDMYIPEIRRRGILCASATGGSHDKFSEAILFADGTVRICSHSSDCPWVFDDPEQGPPLRPGKVVKDPPFRCAVLSRAIRCTLLESRRGFLINTDEALRIAPTPTQDRRQVRASRSCGAMLVEGAVTYDLTIVKGAPSCSTVRRIMKRFGHPISKNPRFYCGVKAYECEYSIYPEGWRCGGLFQGHFQCWHGANSPARAAEIFEGSEASAKRPQAYLRKPAAGRPPCTRRALTRALIQSGGRGRIDGETFGCAGGFAYAGVIVDRNEVTVLFRAVHRHWRPVSRARFCENGSVPKQIYQPACESN